MPYRFDIDLGLPDSSAISALVWPVENATSAVILVHGQSGVKENYWHTAPELGSSFGARIAGTGRTTVAIDLPGYGESDGDPNAVPYDLMAGALRGVADVARAGEQGLQPHDHVVAFGLSMGAVIVNLAAADSDVLDAIIPTGFPLTPPTDEGCECLQAGPCQAAERLYNREFYVDNMDWAVANATIAGYESGRHDANAASATAWYGDCIMAVGAHATGIEPPVIPPCSAQGRAWTVVEQVTVPVFTWVGDHDLVWLGTDLSDEPSYYPNAPRVDTWVVPSAGHFIHNHATQPEMVGRVDAWLAELGI